MQDKGLNFKTGSDDSSSLVFVVVIFVLAIIIWLVSKRKSSGLAFMGLKSPSNNPIQICSQEYLPRGGLLLQVRIEGKHIYLIESNKHYLQIDLSPNKAINIAEGISDAR